MDWKEWVSAGFLSVHQPDGISMMYLRDERLTSLMLEQKQYVYRPLFWDWQVRGWIDAGWMRGVGTSRSGELK